MKVIVNIKMKNYVYLENIVKDYAFVLFKLLDFDDFSINKFSEQFTTIVFKHLSVTLLNKYGKDFDVSKIPQNEIIVFFNKSLEEVENKVLTEYSKVLTQDQKTTILKKMKKQLLKIYHKNYRCQH